MGRQAPDPQYKIITCDVQTSSGTISGYTPSFISGGNYIFQTLFPIGSSGINSTGTAAIGTGIGSPMPYVNGCLVGINDENKAIVDSPNSALPIATGGVTTEDFLIIRSLQFNNRFYTNLLTGNTVTGITGFTNSYALKVTGATYLKQQALSGSLTRQIYDYTDLNANYSLLTTYVNNRAVVSGAVVGLEIIQHTDTGVVQVTGVNLVDTDNNSITTNITFPSIAKDLSYTGDTQRFLIGYQSATGVTSGQLCAVLAEISGTTITVGTPAVIRSVVSSGTVGQSISVTYHSGAESNGFVIATTVSPASAVTGWSTTGQIIAAQPSSGLVLGGTFGAAVPIFASATGVFQPVCTAFNTSTGSYGIVVGSTGTTANYETLLSATGSYQVYQVSGTTITTGIVNSFTGSYAQAAARITGKIWNSRRLAEISSVVTDSGLISYISYSELSSTNSQAGVASINYMHIPYSLSNTGRTQYSSLASDLFNATGGFCNRIPSSPYFKLPTNPYNAPHGSFIFLCQNAMVGQPFVPKTALHIGTLATATGDNPTTGAPGGHFYKGFARTTADNSPPYYMPTTLKFRNLYTLTSGDNSFSDQVSLTGTLTGAPSGNVTTFTPVKLKGAYPNYTGIVVINQDCIFDLALTSTTGEQIYTLKKNVFKTPVAMGAVPFPVSGSASVTYRDPESVGLVINPSGTLTNNRAIINSGTLLTGTVLVKTALTETAKKQLLRDCVKTFTLVENHNIFE
jgi:hypothetical protein